MWDRDLILEYEMVNIVLCQAGQIYVNFFMIVGTRLQNKRNMGLTGHPKDQGKKV